MELSKKSISTAFVIILAITILVSILGMVLMSHQPLVLQGQIETTEIRISGKLPGRVDSFLVREGDWVKAGDTLVVINSPTIEAKYRQVNALEQVAQEQNKKIDAGTRRQIIATAQQLWNKTKSDMTLAQTTYGCCYECDCRPASGGGVRPAPPPAGAAAAGISAAACPHPRGTHATDAGLCGCSVAAGGTAGTRTQRGIG